MAISVLGSQPTPPATSSAPISTVQPAQKTASPADTVKLSQAGQVHLLKQQGQSISQIATSLSITAATIDSYLGITVPKAVSAPLPAALPAQAKNASASTPVAPPTPAKG
jgi:hypothetical protein